MEISYKTSYGKRRIPVYLIRENGADGGESLRPSEPPEGNAVLRCLEVDIEVFGEAFLPSYTSGDNCGLVATDSMKNFVMHHSGSYDGRSLQGFLDFLAGRFMQTYEQVSALRLSVTEHPFAAGAFGSGGPPILSLESSARGVRYVATLHLERQDDRQIRAISHSSGIRGLKLLKTSGSSFVGFLRDQYTSLAEREDRPLQLLLDVSWCYRDLADAHNQERGRYLDFADAHALLSQVFLDFRSKSIQHLVHHMGVCLLNQFPQLKGVSFEGQNCTWNLVREVPEAGLATYTDPFPAYGIIKLTMAAEDCA